MKRKWMLPFLAFFLIFFSSTTAFAQTGPGTNTDQAVQDATANTLQATITVNLDSTGFNPQEVTIEAGDSVTFQNQTSSIATLIEGAPFRIFLPIILRTIQQPADLMVDPTALAMPPADSPSDSITPIPAGGSVTIPFPTVGRYDFYHRENPSHTVRVIVAPAKDFALAPDPLSRTIYIGQSTSFTLNTTALNGFTRPVTLSVTGLPDGVTPAWDTNPATPPAAQVLTLATTGATPPGSYDLVVSGTDGILTHTAGITLVVNALPDLSVTSITFNPDAATTGQPFNLSTQVTNLGPGPALPFSVTWQITPLGQSNVVLSGSWDVPGLAAGANTTLTANPNAPTPGAYTVTVVADTLVLPDPNQTNNTRQTTLGVTGRLDTCGDITSNTTWAYATYVITCSININPGATLTVAPGTIVKFQGATSIVVNGALSVPGTSQHPVFFTSLVDDSVGGDTDNDGSANSPARGDWNSIVVAPTGTASLAYTNIRYGGYYHCQYGCSGDQSPLHVYNGGSAVLDHVTLAQNGGYGIHVDSSSTSQLSVTHSAIETSELNGIKVDGIAGKAITIANNTFTGNGSAGLAAVSLTFNGGSVTALDGNSGSGNAANGIQVNGTLGMDTTLPGNPVFAYVINQGLIVDSGQTLTLSPDTVVKFNSAGETLTVNGNLVAIGTDASHPVTFTSLMDDTAGGDTNNDGIASSPARMDWNSIIVAPGGTTTLTYANIRYGGYYRWNYGWSGEQTSLHVYNGGSAVLDHVTLAQNGSYGIHVEPSGSSQLSVTHSAIETSELNGIRVDGIAGKAITITNNTFSGNGSAGFAAVSLTFNGGSVTALDGNSGTGNAINGIQMNGTLGMDTTLPGNPVFAYVISGGLTVDSGKTLTLSPDAVVKFNSTEYLTVNGSLVANGTDTSHPVTFTSLLDDTAGGDTNNDASVNPPARGDWNSIVVATGGTTTLTYANIRYGGYYRWNYGWSGNDITLLLQGSASAALHHTVIRESNGLAISATGNSGTASLIIQDSTIADNNSTGININNTGTYTLSVSRTIIRNNGTGITLSGSSINATVNHCNIYGNTSQGINNATPSMVDATYDWWGAANGPAPTGTGDGVSANVNFAHYLTVPEVLP